MRSSSQDRSTSQVRSAPEARGRRTAHRRVAATGSVALLAAAAAALAAPAQAAASWTLSSPSVGQVDAAGALLWSDGSASTRVEVATATSASVPGRLVLRASADLCGSAAPEAEISLDGSVLGRTHVVNAASAGSWDYPVQLRPGVAAGTHTVSVRFLNDHRDATCDRNLRLERVTASTGAAPGTAPLVPAGPRATAPATAPATTTTPATAPATPWTAANPFAAGAPYADPAYAAAAVEQARRAGDLAGAAALERIRSGGVSLWVGDWNSTATVAATVREYALRANAAGRTGVVTTYAVPGRDCGNHSAGGLTPQTYSAWSAQVAAGLRGTRTAVVVEPDAIAQVGACAGQGDRLGLLRTAVQQLRAAGVDAVYLDAGNSGWTGGQVALVAERLRQAGVEQARGFATNVSNFMTTAQERTYAEALSARLGGARYVVDTSRNGVGGNGEWCNPGGRKLGAVPGAVADGSRQDANLWIKRAGESDGPCNGGPAAGTFWPGYAIGLGRP
ncbi:glycoside hydrolase family 6 protein [Kineococcus sp. SYSU DK006]|uniref:glycoside hydrolase family 6 protein n=1 Tax=Kineococcus sp. SYSU DK006 TaxID=3383127 RepID=UPI003D7D9749